MNLMHRTPIRLLAIALLPILLFSPIGIPLRVVVLACAAVIWTLVEARSLSPLGLGRHPLIPTLVWGVGLAVVLTIVGEVADPLIELLTNAKPDYSGYGALAGNASAVLQMLVFAWISAAICEEILFRGFLLHQITAILGTGAKARWTAIVGSGVLFGIGHMIQGPLGIVNTGFVGMVFAWAWFRSGRNLWALMLAHGLTDTYGLTMLYLGRLA